VGLSILKELKSSLGLNHSCQQIDVVGKLMIPSTQKASSNATSVTADTHNQDKLLKLNIPTLCLDFRVERMILSDVCLDCADFLNHSCVECEDCPVERLKLRFKKVK
jgi:hypothetical protein